MEFQQYSEVKVNTQAKVDLVNSFTKKSAEKAAEIDSLFRELESAVMNLTSSTIPENNKINWVEQCIYYIFQMRVKLSWEQMNLRDLFNASDKVPQMLSAVKKREITVAAQLQRLNELRDDVTSIQKILWVKKNSNF